MVICTYAGAQVSGIIMRSLSLPSLLGQLLFGLFLSLFLSSPLPLSITSPLKSLSLTVLLIRAGISINISNLLPEFYLTLGLSFLPFVIEAGVVAGFSWFLLNQGNGGAEIDFTKIDQRTVLVGTAIIACGLVFRFGATYLCCRSIGGYCYKRSLFVATCWMPKATVQAALCTIALDFVRSDAWWKLESKGHPHYSETEMNAYRVKWEGRATDVLNVGVLSIILTAPICAYIIPKLVRPLVEEPLLLKLKEAGTVRQRNSFGTQGQAQVYTSIDGSQTWVETPTKLSGMSYDMEEIKRVKSV
ncbi:hypothetical protein TrST_g13546 [Triparma strigata]|uniref:Uncharacterized protein n=1 Tax=Triparma strigata TaxID=1606541 RepID=A0A9W6ZIB3_9STRA|nr:hypothetical protein TrST_g13546 [Triparma strigata]